MARLIGALAAASTLTGSLAHAQVPLCPPGTHASGKTCARGSGPASDVVVPPLCPAGKVAVAARRRSRRSKLYGGVGDLAATGDLAERCCWPGQRWKRGRCVGSPRCPLAFTRVGRTCEELDLRRAHVRLTLPVVVPPARQPDGVLMQLRRNEKYFRRCLALELRRTDRVDGKLTLALHVGRSGKVARARVLGDPVGSPALARCIAAAAARARFKRTKGPSRVRVLANVALSSLPPSRAWRGARVRGLCDARRLERALQKRSTALRGCLGKRPAKHLTMGWTITQLGKAQHVEVAVAARRAAGCARDIVKKLRFAKPEAGICWVRYRLELAGKDSVDPRP